MGALGLSREATPAHRARPMTPGDIQNGRVGPDPTAGSKTVASAAQRCPLWLRFGTFRGLGSVF